MGPQIAWPADVEEDDISVVGVAALVLLNAMVFLVMKLQENFVCLFVPLKDMAPGVMTRVLIGSTRDTCDTAAERDIAKQMLAHFLNAFICMPRMKNF